MSSERRDADRLVIGEVGTVTIHGVSRVDCKVVDASLRGAKLRFSTPVILPKRFQIAFEGSTEPTEAIVVWQRGTSAGVRLSKPHPEAAKVRKPVPRPRLRLFG